MVENNEVLALVLALGVLAFLSFQREQLRVIPHVRLLAGSFLLLCAGYVLTVLEGLFWYDLLNTLEHVCNNLSIVCLVLWAWRLPWRKGKDAWP